MLPLENIYQGRTLVWGHRGARAYAPMNTIPSFEMALAQGATGVELDTHLSKDGQLIVLHDFSVDATTDGKGLAKNMTLAQLKELDAGSSFSKEYAGVRIPTLSEVFEAVGQKCFINVEIKSDTQETDGVEQAVADCIRQHGLEASVIISSFNPLALKRFRAILPNVPIGYLYAPDYDFSAAMDGLAHEARHPQDVMIDAAYMEWARQHNYRVNTWTVNDPQRAAELYKLGVDAIITDKPDVIIEAISETSR
ncbi:MAG: glycerophosphodiester phosphodiesterase [Chloroflexi bacterium]|nr:glycerophosphodiester phosphodiesterase [Chloroflexota bacterium]MCC6892115.1 glycerophosphodiester phosphodiesterase [Anaerolineae bacterium]